jgi:hypothetical protein
LETLSSGFEALIPSKEAGGQFGLFPLRSWAEIVIWPQPQETDVAFELGTEDHCFSYQRRGNMITFFLWCILFVVCWPLALLALVLYPLIWLLLLPFRIVGIAVGGVMELVKAIIFLPARVLRGRA